MILILTAGFGDGHNTAARSVAEALTRLCPDEKIETSDLISEALPLISDVCKSLYQFAITHWPGLRLRESPRRSVGRLSACTLSTATSEVWQATAMVNEK